MITRVVILDILCNVIAIVGGTLYLIGINSTPMIFLPFVIGGAMLGLGLFMRFDILELHPKHLFKNDMDDKK